MYIYLCKLRLGVSNRLLTSMFQLPDKRIVSRIINSARQAILKTFIPNNLGLVTLHGKMLLIAIPQQLLEI